MTDEEKNKLLIEYGESANLDISEKERTLEHSFVMIRKDIWDYIIDNYKGEYYNKDCNDYKSLDFYLTAKVFYRKQYEKAIKESETFGGRFLRLFDSPYESRIRYIKPHLYNKLFSNVDDDTKEDIFNQWMEFNIIN